MMRYNPVTEPTRKDKTTQQIHDELDSKTSAAFDGITARNGVVNGVVGDLSESDIKSVEDYLEVSLIEVDE